MDRFLAAKVRPEVVRLEVAYRNARIQVQWLPLSGGVVLLLRPAFPSLADHFDVGPFLEVSNEGRGIALGAAVVVAISSDHVEEVYLIGKPRIAPWLKHDRRAVLIDVCRRRLKLQSSAARLQTPFASQ